VRLESRPGGGASFHIELPVSGGALPAEAEARARSAALSAATAGAAALLVVEDEVPLATAVVDSLRDAGYLVEHALDGEAALEKVAAQSFDAVICDLKMPRLDGQAFYRALEGSAPGLARRVVFVTGDVAGTEAGTFLEQSGCRWLAKPFRLADLLRTVRDVLA